MFENKSAKHGDIAIGIDIGTTTISASVIDLTAKKQIDAFTVNYSANIISPDFSEQSVDVIINEAEMLLNKIHTQYKNIVSIGLTGQMHGIAYVDKDGNAISNLMNWQDKRADKSIFDGRSTCEIIKHITGEKIATGYGLATHFYNSKNDLVPADAAGFGSIMDILGMKLCGIKKPVIHTSVAASFGLFDLKNGCFMKEKCALLGIDKNFLPKVTDESCVIGKWNGIPVSIAIGDNQASFLGSVKDHKKSILVNIGTGSQTSAVCDFTENMKNAELRPLIEGKYLACGSALCGGAAYSLLEKFFREYAKASGIDEASQYETVNALALEAYNNKIECPIVDTTLGGTRADPSRRGSVTMINMHNFTPGALALGFIEGMCSELYSLCDGFCTDKEYIVASGGAVRKNKVLKNVIGDTFDMPVYLSGIKEEAATGAALFGAFASEKILYSDGFSDFINYKGDE